MNFEIVAFQASGVKINDDIKTRTTEIQMEKKFKYIIFRINKDMKEVIVDKCADKGMSNVKCGVKSY